MFLNQLSQNQKELFLDLCINASNVNGEFSDEEKIIIRQYAEEMNIGVRYVAQKETEAVLNELLEISVKSELKAILIELIALLYSDNSFDEIEVDLAEKIADKFGISKEDFLKIEIAIRDLSALYEELYSIVEE